MSFSGMGAWKPVPAAESKAGINQSLKRADEVMASLGKARVKVKEGGTWEDEELMYEIERRKLKRAKRKVEAAKVTPEEKEEARLDRKRKKYMMEERKVFLGGLAEETTEKDVMKVFEVFGTIVDMKVMRDVDTGKSRQYGFLTFAQEFMLEACLEADTGHGKGKYMINDKIVIPKRATPDEPRYRMCKTEFDATTDIGSLCEGKRSIFVGSLRDNIDEDDMRDYFSGFGRVVRAHKIVDKETGIVHNYGFVDFADYGVVRKVFNVTKHYIKGKRVRIDMSRRKIEFSLQTKTIYVGELVDGIDDSQLYHYFSEFGFVVSAFRIPDQDGPKQNFGFVEFDAFDSVDIVVQQREHYIQGHRIRVDLALPIVNDMMYADECAAVQETVAGMESWEDHVQRKMKWAIPDEGAWGEKNNYEIFVKGGVDIVSSNLKIPRGMLEFVAGMSGRVIEGIADDTGTRCAIRKAEVGASEVVITITGTRDGIKQATYIMSKIVKSNIHRLNLSATSLSDYKKPKQKKAGVSQEGSLEISMPQTKI